MSRKSPLFDPSMIIDDMCVTSMSCMAQLLFIKIMALCNKSGTGYMVLGTVPQCPFKFAARTGFDGDVQSCIKEICEMGLLEEDGDGWFVPHIREAAVLRAKRSRAGAKGGIKTTAQRSDVCLSNVISFDKSRAKAMAYKKEKRTKKEKNNNIYIYSQKIFTGDRGDKNFNPSWFSKGCITLFKREYKAIQACWPHAGMDKIDDLLAQQADYLDGRSSETRRHWLGMTLSFLRTALGEPVPVEDRDKPIPRASKAAAA